MGKKIFVSYKYADSSVARLPEDCSKLLPLPTTVRRYVDKLEEVIGVDNIFKGEHDGEDLSKFKDETIWSKLKDKIFDSSVTIVLISKNMKDFGKIEDDQWIPHEIAYSLKELSRTVNGNKERKSRTNALISIVLPDKNGSYDYYIKNVFGFNNNITFNIINRNLYNNKSNILDSYIVTVTWDVFLKNPQHYIELAVEHQDNIDKYDICKQV